MRTEKKITRDDIVAWIGQCDNLKDIELIVRAARARIHGISDEIDRRSVS